MKTFARLKAGYLYVLVLLAPVCVRAQNEATVIIDVSKTYQTIENFGASDAWACQFVGNWPNEKRNKIADLLFSRRLNADGSPQGIALSMWRFNIGAGSAEQGDGSCIKDEWRRAQSFMNADGTYNWEKQAGQVWFLKAAKARGVKQFLGFSNSPPVQYTVNGKAYANKGATNISAEKYTAFAAFLANVVKGVEQKAGIKFNYIGPVNEPQWDWSDGGQEGCPYTNAEMARLTREIAGQFNAKRIDAKILLSEAGSIEYLYSAGNKKGKGNQAADFFEPQSANYVGNLGGVAPVIAGHSYFTTSPQASAIKMRGELARAVNQVPGLRFWQSEYCILGDNAGDINGSKRDLGIDAALYLAGVIHTDLTVANATAWQWWTAVSAYDYKDGLVYVDKEKSNGNYYDSKMLWALGNFSRFINPGAVRVDAVVSQTDGKALAVSAYKQGRNITAVLINPNNYDVKIKLNGAAVFKKMYVTSQTASLKANVVKGEISIPARSVTTLTGAVK